MAEPYMSGVERIRSFAIASSAGELGMEKLLQSVKGQIMRGDWFMKFKHFLQQPKGFVRNTQVEESKHPDRHCFHLPGHHPKPQGKYKYKCIWCHYYNRGVGLQETDACLLCGRIQIRHPDFERLRKEVEEHERLHDPYAAAPERRRGTWLEAKRAAGQFGKISLQKVERRIADSGV